MSLELELIGFTKITSTQNMFSAEALVLFEKTTPCLIWVIRIPCFSSFYVWKWVKRFFSQEIYSGPKH